MMMMMLMRMMMMRVTRGFKVLEGTEVSVTCKSYRGKPAAKVCLSSHSFIVDVVKHLSRYIV